jgi:hypothetical protein
MKQKKNKPAKATEATFIQPATKSAPPPRPRWLRRCAIALLIYAVLGFLVLPAILKWQLRKQLPALTHRAAEVKQVRINPFALSLTLRGVSLTESNGAPFAAFDELYVNFQLSSVFRGAWTFGDIRLVHPTANLVRLAEGGFNFSNLAGTNSVPNTNPPAPPPAVLIQSLLVTNAVVTFADETTSPSFKADYGPINLAIRDFTTQRDAHGPYTFVATTSDGETFAWSGRISVNPPRSYGRFDLSGITPAKYAAYLAQFTTVQLVSGKISIGADYHVNAGVTPLELDATNGVFKIENLLVKPPASDAALIAMKQFVVTNASMNLTGQVASVGLVSLNGGEALIGLEADGSLSVFQYLKEKSGNASEMTNAVNGTSGPWRFDLSELDIANFNLLVEDHSTPTVAELGLEALRFNVRGFSTQTNTPVEVALGFNWRGGGSVNVTSRGTVMPPDLSATLTINELAIVPLQPYIGQKVNLVVHSGGVSVDGVAKFNPSATPQIHFAGDVGVTNFASSDTTSYHEFASWKNLSVRGIDFSLLTNALAIEEVKFVEARNNFVISSNGVLNVAALPKLKPAADTNEVPQKTENAEPRAEFPIRVGALVLENNSIRLADDSLPNKFHTSIEEFRGSIRDFVFPGLNKSIVDICGKVSAVAPFEIVGEVTPDPKNLFVNLKVAFTNTDLTPLSPYTEKYVGRPINKGKLTFDLRYNIEQRMLKAQNVVALDKFTFGAKNDSPDATKLPVKLAVGLLKDIDGRIELDLPVEGSLDDPKFSIWGLVGQTLKNVVLKIATSPFSLLGSLVGSGDDMQFIEFSPGSATLADNQTNKLMNLSTALAKRPALTMEIGATFDPLADVEALSRQKVRNAMRLKYVEQLVARGKPVPAIEQLVLEDGDYEKLLRDAYKAAFNTTPEQSLRDALSAALATNNAAATEEVSASAASDTRKGASLLMRDKKSLVELAAAANPGFSNDATKKPKTERELVRDELEMRFATTMPVSGDDLRALMQKRVEIVQRFLLENGKIEGERLLPAMRAPEDSSSRGLSRVVFSLD